MKRLFILIFILPGFIQAQEKQLAIQGVAPDLYISHTVAPKDNYYSIGRLYNINPKEFASFNSLQMDKGLNLGQPVKIPLTNTNFTQTAIAGSDEVLVPVHYVVKAKDGLYRVSAVGNKVPIESIKKWNNLTSDELKTGSYLIVGYLKVKKELSALANTASNATATVKKSEYETVKENTIVAESGKEIKSEDEGLKEMVKPMPKEKEAGVIKESIQTDTAPMHVISKDFSGGVFKAQYNAQNEIEVNGQAGIFKSTSGWEDGRYYCLHNSAEPQTIVKITNNVTGKSIYAKVMDMMPDIKQNKGLVILISNAAADQLGVAENKFDCSISYSK
ncbi:MAG: LysM peptidoglycan-binding domain-containing protein [Chitinophagaceae bacterium]|nr:LysM peptidoglycan-binding domain-containing protein [Chitinophagaceae bacterium]